MAATSNDVLGDLAQEARFVPVYDEAGFHVCDVDEDTYNARDVCIILQGTGKLWMPIEHAAFVPFGQAHTPENLIAPDVLISHAEFPLGVQVIDRRECFVPGVLTDAMVRQCLPHICESGRRLLLQQMAALKKKQFSIQFIREQPSGLTKDAPLVTALMRKITITSGGVARTAVQFEGEELLPYAVHPVDPHLAPTGVEFRGSFSYEVRTTLIELQAAVQERIAQLAHCKKLLQDLPIALQNSIIAMEAHAVSENVDLTTLGAMVLEQTRLKQEIQTQKLRLPELEASVAADRDPVKSTATHRYQTSLVLPFGVSTLDCTEYTLALLPTNRHAEPAQSKVIVLLQPEENAEGGGEKQKEAAS
jgi:hypothetical protein